MDPNASDKAPDAAASWPDQIYDLLKKHEIRQVCLVPDAGHSRLIKRCLADNEIKVTTLTTEEEGIAAQTEQAIAAQQMQQQAQQQPQQPQQPQALGLQ